MANSTTPYWQKLKDPRWQRRRLEILARDGWACQKCGDASSTLHVHHLAYSKGVEPWDYPDNMLVAVCEACHESEADTAYRLVAAAAEAHPGTDFVGDWIGQITEALLFATPNLIETIALLAELPQRDRVAAEEKVWAAIRGTTASAQSPMTWTAEDERLLFGSRRLTS